ncbi:hypothetical protein LDC_0406 [sediment metagenome]|uniref:Response regulatory domain-containing protein n=1 Tax=sediment metagenome TaxID=749907 RepID=D9PFW1_9ZZZZ
MYGSVQEHDGGISFSSQVGQGATFRILLPLNVQKPVPAAAASSATASTPGHGRLLLVDDEASVRATTAEALQSLGYEVLQARDGAEGLAVFLRERETLRAVLLDLVMPERSGEECFREFRRHAPALPVLILSGYARDARVEDLVRQGPTAFLKKPFRHDDLVRALANVLPAEPRPK